MSQTTSARRLTLKEQLDAGINVETTTPADLAEHRPTDSADARVEGIRAFVGFCIPSSRAGRNHLTGGFKRFIIFAFRVWPEATGFKSAVELRNYLNLSGEMYHRYLREIDKAIREGTPPRHVEVRNRKQSAKSGKCKKNVKKGSSREGCPGR